MRVSEIFSLGSPRIKVLSCTLILFQFLFGRITALAQELDTAAASNDTTVGVNQTIKGVFSEAKEIVKTNESTWTSIFMILMVVLLVIIALWLSFKSSSTDDKRKKVLDRQRKRNA